jgi:hypothetical protein
MDTAFYLNYLSSFRGTLYTQGAVLYLLMRSQNAQDVNHRLGGILVAVLEHAHFKKYGVPTIDRLKNTALS